MAKVKKAFLVPPMRWRLHATTISNELFPKVIEVLEREI